MNIEEKAISMINDRDIYIADTHDNTRANLAEAEAWLYTQFLQKIVPHLQVSELGAIEQSTNMVRVTKIIQDIFKEFREDGRADILNYLFKRLDYIGDLTNDYYSVISPQSARKIEGIVGKASKAIDNTYGLTRGEEKLSSKKGSKIEKVIYGTQLKLNFENTILGYVQSGANKESLIDKIDLTLTGGHNTLSIDNRVSGGLQAELGEMVYVSSRHKSSQVAKGIGLKYYLYSGTKLVDGTRPFCGGGYDKKCGCTFKDKVGNAFALEEILSWKSLKWSGKPSKDYDPFSDLGVGGFRCRHDLIGITKKVYDYIRRNR